MIPASSESMYGVPARLLRAGVNRVHRVDGVRLGRRLVGPVPLHACKAQRDATGVARARLHAVEGDLDDELRPNEDDVTLPSRLELEQALRLPREQLVGQALERLAEHHEASADGIPGTEVEVRQLSLSATVAPLGREHHEIEGVAGLHLQPAGAST